MSVHACAYGGRCVGQRPSFMYWFLLHTLLLKHSLLAVSAAVLHCALNSPISCLFLPSHHNGAGINKGCYRSKLSYLFLSTFFQCNFHSKTNVLPALHHLWSKLYSLGEGNYYWELINRITDGLTRKSRAGEVIDFQSLRGWKSPGGPVTFYFLGFSEHPDSVELTWVWEFTLLENTSSTSELYHWEMLWNPETRNPALLLLPGEDVAKGYVSRE